MVSLASRSGVTSSIDLLSRRICLLREFFGRIDFTLFVCWCLFTNGTFHNTLGSYSTFLERCFALIKLNTYHQRVLGMGAGGQHTISSTTRNISWVRIHTCQSQETISVASERGTFCTYIHANAVYWACMRRTNLSKTTFLYAPFIRMYQYFYFHTTCMRIATYKHSYLPLRRTMWHLH